MLTVPSVSVAVAAMLVYYTEVKLPVTGLVKVTAGATLAGAFTLTATDEEVVIAPSLSVAFAVIVYDPADTPLQL